MSDLVTIIVNGCEKQVRRGPWIVKDLKKATGVRPEQILALIEPMGLTRYCDDDEVETISGLNYMSHSRPGRGS